MMKELTYYRKVPPNVLMIFLIFISLTNQAQSVKRESVSSYCTIITPGSLPVEQTAGQPYNTSLCIDNSASILPGFQQPLKLKVEKLPSESLTGIEIYAYPNPASNEVRINCKEPIENGVINLLDCNGKLIMTDHSEKLQTYILDCSELSNGVYFITVNDYRYRKSSMKLIINK